MFRQHCQLHPQLPQPYRPHRYRLGSPWEAEVQHAADIYAVEIESPAGPDVLCAIRKTRTSGFLRLLYRLVLVPGDAQDVVLCYRVTISRAGILETSGMIQEDFEGDRRYIATARYGPWLGSDSTTAIGLVHVEPNDIAAAKLYLAFDCSADPGRLEVTDFHVEAFEPNWLDGRLADAVSLKRSAAATLAEAKATAKDSAVRRVEAGRALTDPAEFHHAMGRIIAHRAGKAASQHTTPYYRLLSEASEATTDLAILAEVKQTLTLIDEPRTGWLAPAEGPLVSVVMPVYNREGVVAEAIASVLAQTYTNFELLVCDDASDDATPATLAACDDPRVRRLRHPIRRGAAAARNTCLQQARGGYVAYLDSDNLWHPRFVELTMEELQRWPGHGACYASYFDVQTDAIGRSFLIEAAIRSFHLEDQIEVPFIDLNSFVHRRELVELFGGFDERLVRRQDHDLIVRYCWARAPRHVPVALNLYRRIANQDQITQTHRHDSSAPAIIRAKFETYYDTGLPTTLPHWLKKATVVSWDMSRNHFAKAFSVAEALSRHIEVQLISFRFFEERVFRPLAASAPSFETLSFEGADFPRFFDLFYRAIAAVSGDVLYAVKPRLPSLGLALLAHHRTGKPIFLEANDLETVIASPRRGDRHVSLPLASLLARIDEARVPHAQIWSQVLDYCAQQIPTVFTHNVNLDHHYGRRCLYMRNVKDQSVYDPLAFDREATRAELNFEPNDRVILFGGLVRRHKGIFELAEFVDRLGTPYRLLVVGSRETPDLEDLQTRRSARITVLGPQPAERMAALNLAADLVVLWLDPAVPASHYQCPYKLTDALAMGPAIVASPVGELAVLAERELLWPAPFGDFDALATTISSIFADEAERRRRKERARKLFLREFSYNAVLPAFALAAARADPRATYPVAAEFAGVFEEFRRRAS